MLELDKFIDLIKKSSKPIFYTGGGVINSGPEASKYLRELVSFNWISNYVNFTRTGSISWRRSTIFRNVRNAWNL